MLSMNFAFNCVDLCFLCAVGVKGFSL